LRVKRTCRASPDTSVFDPYLPLLSAIAAPILL
jgi:hypothetical protein